MSNAGASLLRGFPVSSSASRTAIARTTGARTQVYSLTALAAVVAVLLFARPVLASFPLAALAAIVVYAAANLVDTRAFRRLAAFRRSVGRRGIVVGLARVKQDLLDDLQAFGLSQKIGKQLIFPTLPTAVPAYQEWARHHPRPGPDIAA